MTLGRRLLASASGAGSFAEPVPVESVILAAPNGGWPSVTASAIRHNGVVYIGYIDASGNVEIVTFTEATGVTSAPFTLHATLEVDWHDAPAVTVRADGRIVVAYSAHAGPAMYVRISTNPEDITAWGAETNIDSTLGGDAYTYPTLYRMAGDSDRLVMVYRDEPSGELTTVWCYTSSADGGVTWAAQTDLYRVGDDVIAYMHVNSDDDTRLDFVVDGADGKLYHFYMTPTARRKTDGTLITASLPLVPANLSEVCSITGVAALSVISNRGAPVIVAPGYSAPTETLTYCYWNGSTWIVGGSPITSYTYGGTGWAQHGGIALMNAGEFYTAQPVSGTWEVIRYRTWDHGATWHTQQISASPSDDFYPVAVRDPGRLRAVWLRGTATSYTNYNLGIVGAAVP